MTRLTERLTFDRAVAAVALVLAFAIAVSPAVDNDLWWHLRSGRWMVDHGSILRADPFSYTRAGEVRQPTDWLGQLALYGAWAAGGLTAVALLTAGLAAAGMALLLRACRGPVLLRAGVILLASAASTVFWTARPQMFTFLLTAAVVLVLAELRRCPQDGARRLWLLLPLFALWSNLHLGWFYGLAVVWATVVGEAVDRGLGRPALPAGVWRRLATVAALSSVAVVANPVGPRVYGVILTQVDVGRKFIAENQPARLGDSMTTPFYVLLALTVLVLVLRWRKVSATELLLVAGTAGAAVNAVRTISFFATVASPILARHAAAVLDDRRERRREATAGTGDAGEADRARPNLPALNLALVLAVVAVAGTLSVQRLSDSAVEDKLRRDFPVAAVDWIRSNRPPGNLYNTFDWGGYLIWELPEYPVSLDGRADLYTDQLSAFDRTRRAQGWEAEFARLGVRLALLDTGGPLARAVAESPAWQVSYQDTVATVLVARSS